MTHDLFPGNPQATAAVVRFVNAVNAIGAAAHEVGDASDVLHAAVQDPASGPQVAEAVQPALEDARSALAAFASGMDRLRAGVDARAGGAEAEDDEDARPDPPMPPVTDPIGAVSWFAVHGREFGAAAGELEATARSLTALVRDHPAGRQTAETFRHLIDNARGQAAGLASTLGQLLAAIDAG